MGSPSTKARRRSLRAPAGRLGDQPGGAGGFPLTGWRDRLALLRVSYADAVSANCADSPSTPPNGTNGTIGIGIKAAELPLSTPPSGSQGNCVIPVLPVVEQSAKRGDIARVPVPSAGQQPSHVAGYLNTTRQCPPSWSDSTALPAQGCFCSCCKGQRWWRERDAPKGWRCWMCHPPNHLPSEQTQFVYTGQGTIPDSQRYLTS